MNDGMGMQTDSSGQTDDLDAVLAIIAEIARKSTDGNYIYRGEPECFPKVSSSLYRQYDEIEAEDFNIEIVQQEMLDESKLYTTEADDFEILTQLQHYGGKTNLIDFTTDFLIAIFFASDGSPDNDGRVIFLQRSDEPKSLIKEPRNPMNRVIAQKSIFVQPPEGFIQADEEVVIPSHLKGSILDYLRSAHGISTESIHNDIFGFIRHQNLHQSAYTEFYRGLSSQMKGDFEAAIAQYSESIRLNPQHYGTYYNRGSTFFASGEPDLAIGDFNSTIDLNPKFAGAYVNRGVAFSENGDIESAIRDYDEALELEPDNPSAFSNRGNAYSDKGLSALAMRDHNKAIELEPENASCYLNRGVAYNREGAHGLAIEDYNKALELDPGKTTARYNRGEAWLCLAKWEKAKSDLIAARDTGMDVVSSFRNEFESVSHFEQKYSFQIPGDIAEMLGG